MKLYFKTLAFNYKVYLAYPWEILSKLFRSFLEIIALVILWFVISESGNLNKSITELLSYFLISSSVANITMSMNGNYGRTIRKLVKSGNLNQVLIKPVNVVPYLYAETLGQIAINHFTSIVNLIVGLIIFPLTNSSVQLTLFFLMLLPAFIISFCFNLLEGALSFIIVEISGFKNSFRHISRLMSGAWVPLYFFPDGIRQVAETLPFAPAVFGPVNALRVDNFTEISQMFLTGVIWSAVLVVFSFVIWRACLKKYDGVGI